MSAMSGSVAVMTGRSTAQHVDHGQVAATTGTLERDLTSQTVSAALRAQSVNLTRHAAALRPFHRGEFGPGAASPTEGHIQAVNQLLSRLRSHLRAQTQQVTRAVSVAQRNPTPAHLRRVVTLAEQAHHLVRATERVWDFYFEFFGQRQSRFAEMLLAADRIALDCYQYTYLGLGKAKSIPAPSPMSYMRTGFSPSTLRRATPLRRLGLQPNPFPIIQLPYHRLVNPWTLGAVLHEVSHNLQNELGLAHVVPATIVRRLVDAGCDESVAAVYARWNRETFADLNGLLLGGPAIVGSLIDILARSPASATRYSPRAVHPVPVLRTFLSTELLKRMGFQEDARRYRRTWERIYAGQLASIPPALRHTFPQACHAVVDTICFQPYAALGNRSLAQVVRFEAKEQEMIEEAAGRLAKGIDPGVLPERFLIGAARSAFDRQLAQPSVIANNFYLQLARR
jgi:hypothetical protein